MDTEDLPYRAEYAKSGRASCRGCKSVIGKDTLRLAVMVQSPMFDGKVPHWYHMSCFFSKQRPKTSGDIAHFESLRYDDQQKIKEKIESGDSIVVPIAKKRGKKRTVDPDESSSSSSSGALKDFNIEYAKSGRAICRGCEQKILKDEIRISKKDFETDIGKRYGGQDMWHHVECFAKLRSELRYFETGEVLPGFKKLKAEDKALVKKHIPPIKQEELPSPVKKAKIEDEVDNIKADPFEKQLKEQSVIIFKYRDLLKKELKKKDLQTLLEFNHQTIPIGIEKILDRLSDIMTFGALKRCSMCKKGQLVFNKSGYICTGNLTEWTKCQAIVKEPPRTPFMIPEDLKEEYNFLDNYKYVKRTRLVRFVPPSSTFKTEEDEVDSKPKVEREKPALLEMVFVLDIPPKKKTALTKEILKLGGKIQKKITKKELPLAVIASVEKLEEENMSELVSKAKSFDVHVVSEDFVNEAKNNSGKIPELINKKSICNWGADPQTRMPIEKPRDALKSKSKSMFSKSGPSKITMQVKSGGAVDPESGLSDTAHIYQKGKDKYNAVLSLTDLQKQKNSFYKLQLLESDGRSRYWVFRSWGRIATSVGGNKVEKMSSLYEAISNFEALYEEKTGNKWCNRHNFVKIPDRFYPVDIDYNEAEEELLQMDDDQIPSKLDKPVQDLIKMLFDVKSMKKVMMEFELDTEKMPLGKLSKKQIHSAFSVLSELQDLVNKNGEQRQFIDASNRFYTFIPHSFGMDNPPILNTSEMIKEKLDMLDSLLELEIAYNIMKNTGASKATNHIDKNYEQLKTDLEVLSKDHEDFSVIKQYVKNTHATTHSHYDLDIEEVFKVKRHGEEKRYKPFRKLHNRKLLWHGSRSTNFVGILSQGLRIAPPEAPVTGYMFGKGIYFADMVSKSANYCCTNNDNPVGLMLLCEVALGEMHECKNADYIQKLPSGKHSCKGVGMTHPNPQNSIIKDDGLEIPLGEATQNPLQSSLLYNEYIVYDVAQVNVKYLLKMNFKYKY